MLSKRGIVELLREHLADPDSTVNDSAVEDLYREYHDIEDGRDIDLERIERWAAKHCLATTAR